MNWEKILHNRLQILSLKYSESSDGTCTNFVTYYLTIRTTPIYKLRVFPVLYAHITFSWLMYVTFVHDVYSELLLFLLWHTWVFTVNLHPSFEEGNWMVYFKFSLVFNDFVTLFLLVDYAREELECAISLWFLCIAPNLYLVCCRYNKDKEDDFGKFIVNTLEFFVVQLQYLRNTLANITILC